jgi:membrane associated rhomboid family serine protease
MGGFFLGEIYLKIKRFIYRDFIPVTKSTVVLSFILLVITSFFPGIQHFFTLVPLNAPRFPWTLITYPLINLKIINLIFASLWLWLIGGALERSWGSKTYLRFLLLSVLATGLSMTLASLLTRNSAILIYGLWLPLVGITWAWAELSPNQEVLVWGIISVKIRWIAWIEAVIVFSLFKQYGLLVALTSLTGVAVVYLFKGKGPFSPWRRYHSSGHSSFKEWWNNRRRKNRKSRYKIIK